MARSRSEPAARAELTSELERLALRATRRVYDDLNQALFRRALRAPALELSDAAGRLGRWVSASRSLELSRALLLEHGWGVLVEVLKHEMAHQYADEVLGVRDEGPHGPTFRRVCLERGIDPRAAGMPRARSSEEHVLERVAKLLALAESQNEHEAQAAMSAAQRLMLKHNIESVAHATRAAYDFRHLGEPSGRIGESQRLLAAILADHFFVEVIWVPVWRPLAGRRGSVLEVCGSPENLELAAYVHAFVNHTGERLFRDYRALDARRGARERERFLAGLMAGFREKLEAERKKSRAEGLVWRGDGALHDFFRARHPHIRMTRHATHSGTEAYARGREAGKLLVVHRGVKAGSSGGPPRLLSGKS
jgi:predicted SprT family Zn-dependent metalloprotease